MTSPLASFSRASIQMTGAENPICGSLASSVPWLADRCGAAAQALGEREAELQAQCAAHVQQVKTLEAALAEVRAAGAADARAAGGGAGAELPDEFYCPITLSVMSDPVCPPSPPESWGSAPGLRAANDLLGPRSRHAPRAAS